jgi:chromosome segregation ATPase
MTVLCSAEAPQTAHASENELMEHAGTMYNVATVRADLQEAELLLAEQEPQLSSFQELTEFLRHQIRVLNMRTNSNRTKRKDADRLRTVLAANMRREADVEEVHCKIVQQQEVIDQLNAQMAKDKKALVALQKRVKTHKEQLDAAQRLRASLSTSVGNVERLLDAHSARAEARRAGAEGEPPAKRARHRDSAAGFKF